MNRSDLPLEDWIILIQEHIAQRPQMQARDIYKLLYQGLLGPEHMIVSPTAFAERLRAELESLSPEQGDPLYEAIRPGQTLLRINLKPFKNAGLDFGALLDACLRTAEITWGEPSDLRHLWESFVSSYHQRSFAAPKPAELDNFTAILTGHEYPAVHHSQIYRQAYGPAYRLVAADFTVQLHGDFGDGHSPSPKNTGRQSRIPPKQSTP